MAKAFITIINGVITGKHHGDMETDFYGTAYYGQEKLEVPFEVLASISPLDRLDFYTTQWERKSDCRLIDEGLIPMPDGYIREDDVLRPMTQDERVLAGLDDPPPGFKVEDGKITRMSLSDEVAAGQITREEFEQYRANENASELQRRIMELQTPEVFALAELDEAFAAERKRRMIALLAVRLQDGWPANVVWPED